MILQRLTKDEGCKLAYTDALLRRHRERKGLDTLLVYAVNDECCPLVYLLWDKLTRKHSAWGVWSQDSNSKEVAELRY